MHNPYAELDRRAFWRTAVADRDTPGFRELYRRKFEISQRDRIVTAGSCFAQHISGAIAGRGMNFCDYEHAHPAMDAKSRKQYNYGVYSARYCNIYTARQLLQTFERAFGERTPSERAWTLKDGVVDPFRPALEPVPFADEEEMMAARESHLRSVRKVFTQSDVLIFTFGLTEAWVSREDGIVFPLCPGVSGGEYDPAKYAFHNFTYSETCADMRLFVQKLRNVNSGIRLLLTVSPVPLTATASGEHVLLATTYSKSILRAVAGEIAGSDPLIDYFPAYELIAAPPMRGEFFASNMRSVSPEGVSFVMSHFFAEHGTGSIASATGSTRAKGGDAGSDDVICEEMLLERAL